MDSFGQLHKHQAQFTQTATTYVRYFDLLLILSVANNIVLDSDHSIGFDIPGTPSLNQCAKLHS